MVKFACVYCFEDNTLTVIGGKSKRLELLGTFEKKQEVRLKWTKNDVYNGCIVKIGEDQEDLSNFATKAYGKILKKLTGKQSTVPEELYSFNPNSKSLGKRKHVETEKIKESKKQDAEFSPRKKKTAKINAGDEQTKQGNGESDGKPQKKKNEDDGHTKKKPQKEKKSAEKNSQLLSNKEILNMEVITSNDLVDQFDNAETTEKETSTHTARQCVSSSDLISNSDSSKDSPSKNNDPPITHPLTSELSNTVDPATDDCQTISECSFNVPCPQNTTNESDINYPRKSNRTASNPWAPPSRWTESNQYPVHGRTDGTSLTDTWALCMEQNQQTQHYSEDIPPAVIELFRLVIRDDVQEYIRGFLHNRVANQMSYSELRGTNQDFHIDHYSDNGRETPYIHSTPKKSRNYIPLIPPQSPSLDPTTYTDLTNIHETSHTDGTVDQDNHFTIANHISNHTVASIAHQSATFNSQQFVTHSTQQRDTSSQRSTTHSTQQRDTSSKQSTTHSTQQRDTSSQQSTTHSTQQRDTSSQQSTTLISTEQLDTSSQQSTSFEYYPRRSPRKHSVPGQQQKSSQRLRKKVKLLKDSNLEVWEEDLRKAASAAEKAHPARSGYVLAYKLIPKIFEREELAQSRGQGLRKKKEVDLRPVLDPTKVGDLKEYVQLWCQKNSKKPLLDRHFNDAITEKITYARRKLKIC